MLKLIAGVGVIALFVWGVITPWHARHNGGTGSMVEDIGQRINTTSYRQSKRQPTVSESGELPTWNHLASRTDLGISDAERDLIMNLQEESVVVPGWVMFCIWNNESRTLSGGWHEGGSWVRANSIDQPGSRCRRSQRGPRGLCGDALDGVYSICAQERSGQPICNPNEVWVSWTGAMGPLQQMPVPFAIRGSGQWQAHVTDYNRDGVYDPHDLEDAMATTAAVLRNHVITYGSLPAAVQAYAGNTPHDHFAKLRDQCRHRWCAVDGYCN